MKRTITLAAVCALLFSLFAAALPTTVADELPGAFPGIQYQSNGWDVSKKDEGIITTTEGGDQRLAFDTTASDTYTFEVTIASSQPNNDDWPCAGVIIADDFAGNGLRLEIFTGWQGTADDHWYKILDPNRNMIGEEVKFGHKSGIESADGLRIKVVREGKNLTIYAKRSADISLVARCTW